MYLIVEIIDKDYNDLQINYHGVCDTIKTAKDIVNAVYKKFIMLNPSMQQIKLEDLQLQQLDKNKIRWVYSETNEGTNQYLNYTLLIKPYELNTEFNSDSVFGGFNIF